MTTHEDAALYERWLTAKDGDAFAEIARRHAPVVFDLAARALGDRTAAEDVVQDALLDLALEPSRKPIEVGLVAWLARFAICRARNQRSSERSRARRQQVVGLVRPEVVMPDERLERNDELEHALADAEPEERAVLAMRFLHGWGYDRIAQTLETSEGAARVRVHRALACVRNRLETAGRFRTDEAGVARGLAAMSVVPLSSMKLDAAISAALDAAGAPVPASIRAPVNRISRLADAMRIGIAVVGVAAGVAAVSQAAPSFRISPSADTVGALPAAAPAPTAVVGDADVGGTVKGSGGDRFGAPRPADWDQGALARLARGELGAHADSGSAGASADPKPGDVRPEGPAAKAGGPAADGPDDKSRLASAFRPTPRDASAANCDPGSSGDERADALASFTAAFSGESSEAPAFDGGPEASLPARDASREAGNARATSGRSERRRVSPQRGIAIEELDAGQRALFEEAADLVRAVVESSKSARAEESSPSRVRKAGVRELRRQYRELRRRARTSAFSGAAAPTRKLARMDRVLSTLVDSVLLADGRNAADLRWPDGVDVQAALEEVIRVLSISMDLENSRRPDATEAADSTETGKGR